MELLKRGKEYAPTIARYGVGIVFFLFGIDQLIRPETWITWIPQYALNLGVSAKTLIYFNGIFDLIIGLSLLSGFLVRFASFLGILHLGGIILSLGYNDVAIRDLGLLLVLISIFLHGPDRWCLQKKKKKTQVAPT